MATKKKLNYTPLSLRRKKQLDAQNGARAALWISIISTKIAVCLLCDCRFETTNNRMCDKCRKETFPGLDQEQSFKGSRDV